MTDDLYRYDTKLQIWRYRNHFPWTVSATVTVYTRNRVSCLGVNLLTSDELAVYKNGSYVLVNVVEAQRTDSVKRAQSVLGVIVGYRIENPEEDGYWFVEKNGKLSLFMGNPQLVPVPLEHGD